MRNLEDDPYSYFDDLLAVVVGSHNTSEWQALSPQYHIDSDVVLVRDLRTTVEGNHSATNRRHHFRIGPVLNLVQSQFYGDTDFWDTTHLAMAVAVRDFNLRINPYDDDDHDPNNQRTTPLSESLENCNLYLSMRWALPQKNEGSNTNAVRSYQSEVILGRNGTRPMAVLGGITSSQSSLLAVLGAVATDGDTVPTGGWEPSHSHGRWQDDDGTVGGRETPLSRVSRQGVPNLSPFSTAVGLDAFKVAPLFSRTIPTNEPDVLTLCQYLYHELGIRRVGILYVNNVYGSNYFASLKQLTDTKGYLMNLTAFAYDPTPYFDFSQTVSALKASEITYLVAALHPPTWKGVVRALLDANLLDNPAYAWFFTDSISPAIGNRWIEPGVSEAEGAARISARDLARALNRTAVVRLSSSNSIMMRHQQHLVNYTMDADFVDYFRNRTGVLLPNTTLQPSIFSMLAYDAVWSVGLAACRVNDTFLLGPDLHDAISTLEFSGASGRVAFNEANTRAPSRLTYEIANIWVDEVGNNNRRAFVSRSEACVLLNPEGGWNVSCKLMFPSGSTTHPASLPAVTENKNLAPMGYSIVVWTLAGFVVFLALSCAVWTSWYRNQPVVRSSQPAFLIMLCVGTLLISLDMIFLPFQGPTMSFDPCMASAWFLALGFTTVFSALFAKTWRILRLYTNARRFRRVSIRAYDVLWPIVILLALNAIVLTLWTVLSPLTWERYPLETNIYGEVTSSTGACLHPQTASTLDWTFLGLLLGLNCFVLILSNYVSYLARHLPSSFNESKYIFMSNVILLESFIIGIPVLVTVRERNQSGIFMVRAFLDAVVCLGVLLPIFVPKFTKVRALVQFGFGLRLSLGLALAYTYAA